MITQDIQQLLDNYTAWLRDKTMLREIEDWVEITTPYLDRHNDCLQIYARRDNGGYLLTDDGYILTDLAQSGCALDSPKRQALLKMTLNGFGVQLDEPHRALQVHASPQNFAVRKHNLVQAMLAVNDLFAVAGATVKSLFVEDVTAWLDLNDVRYTQDVKFTGKSGYDHRFNYVIPKSKKQPERIVRVITRPNRDTAQAAMFAWLDIREVRPSEARAIALLNDNEHPVSSSVVDALRGYEMQPVLWSKREDVREELAA